MIYRLAFAIELGGSKTLPIADAELELQEHLAHLRFLLGIKQARVIERPARKVPNPIVSHLFEMKTVRGVARSDAKKRRKHDRTTSGSSKSSWRRRFRTRPMRSGTWQAISS